MGKKAKAERDWTIGRRRPATGTGTLAEPGRPVSTSRACNRVLAVLEEEFADRQDITLPMTACSAALSLYLGRQAQVTLGPN